MEQNMSFDDYARYISHKYRLAITLAVIRTRPQNVSLEDHVQNLRDNINGGQDELCDEKPDQIDSDEFSIHSDDFDMDTSNECNNETRLYESVVDNSGAPCPYDDIGNENIVIKEMETHTIDSSVINSRECNDNEGETSNTNNLNEINTVDEFDDYKTDSDIEMVDAENSNDSFNILENCNSDDNNLKILKNTSTEEATAVQDQRKPYDHNSQQLTQDITQSIDIGCTEKVNEKNCNVNYSNTEIVTTEGGNNTQNNKVQFQGENSSQKENFGKKIFQNDIPFITEEFNNESLSKLPNNTDGIKIDRSSNKKIGVDLNKATDENKTSNTIKQIVATDSQTNNLNSQELQNTHYSETQYSQLFVIGNKYIHGFRSKIDNKVYISIENMENITFADSNNMDRECVLKETNNDGQMNNEKSLLYNETSTKTSNVLNKDDDLTTTEVDFSAPSCSKQIDRDKNINGSTNTLEIEDLTCPLNENKSNSGIESHEEINENTISHTDTREENRSRSDTVNIYKDVQLLSFDDTDLFTTNFNRKASNNHRCTNFVNEDSLNMDYSSENTNDDVNNSENTKSNVAEKGNALNAFTQFGQNFNDLSDTQSDEDLSKAIENVIVNLDNMPDDITNLKNINNIQINKESTQNASQLEDFDENITKTRKQDVNNDSDVNVVTECKNSDFITFKILEDMKKVKHYLAKRSLENYSNDSGYRSDSQSKNASVCNFGMASETQNLLNISARSLSNYCLEQPLLETTTDITNEISNVLSDLIDRLFEEECCPPFLDELLDSVDNLLKSIYEGVCEENDLQVKDMKIERLLLLTKSVHMQTYTIDKITKILYELNESITNKGEYELENIDKCHNLSYIFDILQMLLEKYVKFTENLTQTETQNSQERIIKKSSIHDIWRKKWNRNFSVPEEGEGSTNKYELTSCSEILNKLIVNCMEEYCLLSYLALKCFNVIQKQ